MSQPTIEDYQWLTSPKAKLWLDRAAQEQVSLVRLTKTLREDLSPQRTHLVLQQIDLRQRGREKFSQAEAMFFTPKLLEQATGEIPANYKAQRFAAGTAVADLCCGLGGDFFSLAARGPAVGLDRDRIALLLAKHNCQSIGHSQGDTKQADAAEVDLASFAAWHIDPDRRSLEETNPKKNSKTSRTTKLEFFSPNVDVIDRLLKQNANAAIKLAPATETPDHWNDTAEREWIGHNRQCKQQMAWFGNLALQPGIRKATILNPPAPPRTISGQAEMEIPRVQQIGAYLFEPHAALLAADLTGALAAEHSLYSIAAGIVYLTGPKRIDDAALACFEIIDQLPFDLRKIKAWLRERGIGRLEVKKRGVDHDPAVVRKQLKVPGQSSATLLLAPLAGQVTAILARRV